MKAVTTDAVDPAAGETADGVGTAEFGAAFVLDAAAQPSLPQIVDLDATSPAVGADANSDNAASALIDLAFESDAGAQSPADLFAGDGGNAVAADWRDDSFGFQDYSLNQVVGPQGSGAPPSLLFPAIPSTASASLSGLAASPPAQADYGGHVFADATVNVLSATPSTVGAIGPAEDMHGPAPATAIGAAALANPFLDNAAPVTDASVGSGGATGAQVQAALDESGLSVNGSGIRVGVLSDSFNDLGGAAADEASGALPSASNIDVISDLSSGGSDEGRAMMQIIHDVAPGASLAFYTAFNSEQDFANGILALAAAGCKVIVDDVSYFDEPFFQNGIVAQAIQTVEAEGVTYVTSAGNEASNGYQAAWTPISGTYDSVALTDAESFNGSLVQTVTINNEGTGIDVPLLLEWNQAFGAATSDLELLVFNNRGQLVDTATNSDDGEPTNPWVGYDFTKSGTYHIAIENLSGPDPTLIKEITVGDGLPATISGANVGTVFGHAMTPGAITVGAVSVAYTPAFGLSPPFAESFSSSGAGTELLFANDGTPLASPDQLSPVVVSGLDDIATTVSGGLSDFYGTSAAAASIAGAAAVLLSANPNLTPAAVAQLMAETALPMYNSAVAGAGLVQLDPAVAAALATASAAAINVTGSTTEAVQGGPAVTLLASAPVVTDSNADLTSATVSIANGSGNAVTGDKLSIAGVQNGSVGNSVTASWNTSTDTLTLTGSATIAVYEALLGEVAYADTGTDTSTGAHPERTVTWTVSDGTASFDATSQIAVDRPPVAANDTASDVAAAIVTATAAAGVLANDTDADADPLTVTGVSDASTGAGTVGASLAGAYGHLTLNANGSYSYVADNAAALAAAPAGSHPHDTFTYTVSDGEGGTAQATLTVTIDRAPVAVSETASVAAGSTVTATAAAGLLANDSDPDGDALTVTGVSDTAHGAGTIGAALAGLYGHLTLNANGSYSYVADNAAAIAAAPAGSHPHDTFTYTVGDGDGGSAQASLTVALDRAPTVSATNVTLSQGQTSIAASSLFTASDPDGDAVATYAFIDTGEGHFVFNGTVVPDNQELDVTAAQLAQVSYQGVAGVTDTVEVRASDGTLWSGWDSFTVTAQSGVLETNGSASLIVENGGYLVSDGGTPVELQYGGEQVLTSNAWVPIGVEWTGSGYQVAWHYNGADQYVVWNTDANGNYTGTALGPASYANATLQAFLSDEGVAGTGHAPAASGSTVMATNGAASLVANNGDYFVSDGGTPVELQYGGTPIATSNTWVPINVQWTGSGYDVAWHSYGSDQYLIWQTDSAGNYTGTALGPVSSTNAALLSFLNDEGLPGGGTAAVQSGTLATNGSATLTAENGGYFVSDGGTPVALQYGGVQVETSNAWVPVQVEWTGNGYEVAWHYSGADQYVIWDTDSAGNYTGTTLGPVSSSNAALQAFLNGEQTAGSSGSSVISGTLATNGSASLIADHGGYFVSDGGTPVALQYGGTQIQTSNTWVPIGVEWTGHGYEVAWHSTGSDQYLIWNTDSNGNYAGTALGPVSGDSQALEAQETNFNTDLNGDGTIGIPSSGSGTNGAVAQSNSVSVGGAGNDSFFFKPDLGTNYVAHSVASESMTPQNTAAASGLAELQALIHQAEMDHAHALFTAGHDAANSLAAPEQHAFHPPVHQPLIG